MQIADHLEIMQAAAAVTNIQRCVESVHVCCTSKRLQLNPTKFGLDPELVSIVCIAYIGCYGHFGRGAVLNITTVEIVTFSEEKEHTRSRSCKSATPHKKRHSL